MPAARSPPVSAPANRWFLRPRAFMLLPPATRFEVPSVLKVIWMVVVALADMTDSSNREAYARVEVGS